MLFALVGGILNANAVENGDIVVLTPNVNGRVLYAAGGGPTVWKFTPTLKANPPDSLKSTTAISSMEKVILWIVSPTTVLSFAMRSPRCRPVPTAGSLGKMHSTDAPN